MGAMTLGKKIALGFGLILLITIVLGLLGVINMNNASDNAEKMSGAYVPEVEIANGLERNFLRTRLSMVTYTFAEKDDAIAAAKESFKKVQTRMDEAHELVKKYPYLVVLADLLKKADTELDSYWEHVLELEQAYLKKDRVRVVLDTSAKTYMEQTAAFLERQNQAMVQDINDAVSAKKLKERLEKIILVSELIDLGNGLRIANFSAAARRDITRLTDGIAEFEKNFEPKLVQLKAITRLQVDINRIKETQKAGHAYAQALRDLYAINKEVQDLDKQLKMHGANSLKYAEDIARAGVKGTKKLADDSNDSLHQASNIMIVGLFAAVLIGIILGFFIIRSITRPVVEAVKTIAESNTQVVNASDQIAGSAQSLADGASSQAASVEEVSATVEQSTAINNQNSDNTLQADTLAKDANHAAQTGNAKIKQLMEAMAKITESSERIAKIIKTIDEIAFQTNLLALNAAVEAARAGEHGLGFAVVADEVKNLAQRSATAAKETASIIEEAIEEIKRGNQIAEDTDNAFANILEKAEKTSGLISEIAVSIKEQAEGMNQIASAMGQIDQVTQSNAANSEEAAAAAEELNAQANAMIDKVRDIAQMVGFNIQMNALHMSSAPKKPAQTMHLEHSPKKAPVAKKSKPVSKPSNEEVFALDDDDLKEF